MCSSCRSYTGGDTLVTIDQLRQLKPYKFRLMAENTLGKSLDWSAYTVCTTNSSNLPGTVNQMKMSYTSNYPSSSNIDQASDYPGRYCENPSSGRFRFKWDPPDDTGGDEEDESNRPLSTHQVS